jgi:hypothetical protein
MGREDNWREVLDPADFNTNLRNTVERGRGKLTDEEWAYLQDEIDSRDDGEGVGEVTAWFYNDKEAIVEWHRDWYELVSLRLEKPEKK